MVYVGEKLRLELARFLEFFIGDRQCLCPFRNFSFQARLSFFKMRGHLVEFLGESLDLIPGLNFEAGIQVTATDTFHSFAQGLERTNHPSRQVKARQESQSQPNQKQAGSA